MTYTQIYRSPLGQMLLAAEDDALTGAWFLGQKHFPDAMHAEQREHPILLEASAWLDQYFSGRQPDFMPPLKLKGTAFQLRVWEALQQIPYGQTVTYGELLTGSARAVGAAVGKNPISLFIPCHRVIGKDGSLTGYAGGIDRKNFLLQLECESP